MWANPCACQCSHMTALPAGKRQARAIPDAACPPLIPTGVQTAPPNPQLLVYPPASRRARPTCFCSPCSIHRARRKLRTLGRHPSGVHISPQAPNVPHPAAEFVRVPCILRAVRRPRSRQCVPRGDVFRTLSDRPAHAPSVQPTARPGRAHAPRQIGAHDPCPGAAQRPAGPIPPPL